MRKQRCHTPQEAYEDTNCFYNLEPNLREKPYQQDYSMIMKCMFQIQGLKHFFLNHLIQLDVSLNGKYFIAIERETRKLSHIYVHV